jgi:hypothetical protein
MTQQGGGGGGEDSGWRFCLNHIDRYIIFAGGTKKKSVDAENPANKNWLKTEENNSWIYLGKKVYHHTNQKEDIP